VILESMLLTQPNVKTIWLTGLSGSGKSTLAFNLQKSLVKLHYSSVVLDGDVIRKSINSNLGFSLDDRNENVRRVAEIAKLLNEQNYIVIVALISPLRSHREIAREIIGKNIFRVVYLDASLSVCELRDEKGLYKKARKALIQDFTGISANYEPPQNADLIIHSGTDSEKESLAILTNFVLTQIK